MKRGNVGLKQKCGFFLLIQKSIINENFLNKSQFRLINVF